LVFVNLIAPACFSHPEFFLDAARKLKVSLELYAVRSLRAA
jgi:hypothetical protein